MAKEETFELSGDLESDGATQATAVHQSGHGDTPVSGISFLIEMGADEIVFKLAHFQN
jgi:hypothetical protein